MLKKIFLQNDNSPQAINNILQQLYTTLELQNRPTLGLDAGGRRIPNVAAPVSGLDAVNLDTLQKALRISQVSAERAAASGAGSSGAVLWDDIHAPAYALLPGATPPGVITFNTSGGIQCYGMAVGEDMQGSIQLPHRYKESSGIRMHVHWAPTTNSLGYVKWELEYSLGNVNSGFTTPTTISVETLTAGNAWAHQVSSFPEITIPGTSISAMIMFRIKRATAAGTAYGAEAAILQVDAHYQVDSDGSAQEFIK